MISFPHLSLPLKNVTGEEVSTDMDMEADEEVMTKRLTEDGHG
jgi:hypothetical protein